MFSVSTKVWTLMTCRLLRASDMLYAQSSTALAIAFNASARSASISSGSESAGGSTRQAQQITGDLPEPIGRLIHFTAG
jgi:hypothetical protein